MMNPATASEYSTIAVLTIVGATPKVPTIPPTETGSALTFHDICA